MLLKIDQFLGTIPRLAAEKLPPSAAQTATNCKLTSGNLRPFKQVSTVNTPAKVGTKKSIYLFGSQYWFHWLDDVDVLRGPIAGDTQERTYFTGDSAAGGRPKVTDSTIATAGGTEYPMNSYTLGIPAPENAPTVALSGSPVPDPADPASQESRVYVYTYVSGWGEEGPPSPPSSLLTWSPGQTVAISALDGAPTGDYNITTKRIYRTLNGTYKYAGEVPVATATFTDNIATSGLGETLPSTTWYMPPAGMKGIVKHPAGFFVGFVGNEIVPSEAFLPHAYNPSNRLTVEYPIVGLGVFGQSILIVTQGLPYVATGSSPDSLILERLEIKEAGVSKRGIVDLGEAVVYPSGNGLMLVGMGAAQNLTESLFTREEWQALNPSSILGVVHDGRYFGFYDTGTVQGGFIVEPGEMPSLVKLDTFATAAFSDPVSNALYLMGGSSIVKWEGSSAKMSLTWKSRPERLPRPASFAWGQVVGKNFSGTLKYYVDGVLKHTQTVTSSSPFRLPSALGEVVEVEVSGTSEVSEILLAEDIEEIKAA